MALTLMIVLSVGVVADDDAVQEAREALAADDVFRAIEILEGRSEDDPAVRRLLVNAYIRCHRYWDGIQVARKLDAAKHTSEQLIDLANTLAENGLTLTANSLLKRAREAHDDPEVLLARAWLQCSLTGYDIAERLAKEAESLGADQARVLRILAICASRSGAHISARDRLTEALAHNPDDPALLFELGRTYVRLRQPEPAIALFWRCLAEDYDHVGALYNLAGALVRAGKREEGNRVLASFRRASKHEERGKQAHEAVRINSRDPRPLIDLAEFLVDDRKPKRAILLAERVRSYAPLEPRALAVLGLARDLLGDRKTARAHLEQAVTLDDTLLDARLRLAELYMLANDLPAAAVHLEQTRAHWNQSRWHLAKGELIARAGQKWEGTVPHLERAVEADPTNLEALLAVVDLGRAFRKVAELRALIETWRGKFPKNPRFDLALGVLAHDEKRYPDAKGHLERAIEKDPWLSASHGYLSRVSKALGETEQAAESAARAKRLRLLER